MNATDLERSGQFGKVTTSKIIDKIHGIVIEITEK